MIKQEECNKKENDAPSGVQLAQEHTYTAFASGLMRVGCSQRGLSALSKAGLHRLATQAGNASLCSLIQRQGMEHVPQEKMPQWLGDDGLAVNAMPSQQVTMAWCPDGLDRFPPN